MELVATGIAGLDEVLGGGFPRENIVLLNGAPGAGKTILGLQFVRHGVEHGEPGVIFTFEQFPEMIYRDAHALGWDFRELERDGKLRVIHTSPATYAEEMRAPGNVIERAIREIGARRCFVDGYLLAVAGNPRAAETDARQLFESLRREGLAVMAAKEKPAEEPYGSSYESFLGDTIIHLTYDVDRARRVRHLEVIKSRGQGFLAGAHSFVIRPGDGIVCFPRFKASIERPGEALGEAPRGRVGTGVEALDRLFGGGPPAGSTTLIAGAPGTGKSILGLHFVAEGARAGERSLLVSLDERPSSLIRQAGELGLGIEGALRAGTVLMRHLPIVELEVNQHLHEIRAAVVKGEVRRLVIDAISTFEAGLDPLSYRDYLVALVELLRTNRVTTYLVAEVADFAALERATGYGTSYLVDNIVLLRYIEHGGELRKVLSVVKVRGSDHDRTIREYRIGPGGVELVGPAPPADAAVPLPLRRFRNVLWRSVEPEIEAQGGAAG
jgi:circadian clock protein KaiC